MKWREWQKRIYATLMESENPDIGMTQAQLSEKLGVSRPTVSQQIRMLKDEKVLSRPPRQDLADKGSTIRAPRLFMGVYVDRTRGIVDEWVASIPTERDDQLPIDLRFPFVTRVRDGQARMFLHEWLDRSEAAKLLPPNVSLYRPSEAHPIHFMLGVYGSCARGDAHAKSDLDLVLYIDPEMPKSEKLVDLAHETLVTSQYADDYRPLDLQVWHASDIEGFSAAFQSRLQEELLTIYTNNQKEPFLEEFVRR